MGIKHVRAVSDHWGHLPAGPYKLLIRMAIGALDTSKDPANPPGHYWKGWRDLSQALGRKPPHDTDNTPDAARERKWMKEEVRRYTSELVRLGAVQRVVDNPGRGTRQVWKLTL